jgi:small subunit ribosomal protein S6
MKKTTYDAIYILDIQGKEEGVKEALEDLKTQIESFDGEVKGSQRLDRRKFERAAGKLDSGYYLGVTFDLAPAKLESLRQKLSLNDKTYRQFYLKLDKPAVKEGKEAKSA